MVVFLGAFLSFGIQPMIGRTLLPVFGGTAAVWVVCLCAFQLLLLGGYFYAHVLFGGEGRGKSSPSPGLSGGVGRLWMHIGLVLAAAVWTIYVARARHGLLAWAGGGGCVALEALGAVLLLVGGAFVLLSANSSLVQVLSGGAYHLYAFSNAGSLCGLLAYPLVIEPNMNLTTQWTCVGVGMIVYAVCLMRMLPAHVKKENEKVAEPSQGGGASTCEVSVAPVAKLSPLTWLIPAVTCFALNSITAHLTLDVMPFPLLWVALLAAFLASYIVGFSDRCAPFNNFMVWLLPIFVAGAAIAHTTNVTRGVYVLSLVSGTGLLFAGCAFLHGRLYALRPPPEALTRYYLRNAVGGAVGGLLSSLVAPMCFSSVAEYPIAVLAILALSAFVVIKMRMGRWTRIAAMAIFAAAATAFVWRVAAPDSRGRTIVYKARGFFGTLKVTELKARGASGDGVIHEYVHGTTTHGLQALVPGKERMATAYYAEDAGGLAIVQHPKYKRGEPMRVCIVGLGVGVTLAHARTNDFYRCYEISPEAAAIATNPKYFTFASDCPAKTEIVVEDARKGLERELRANEPRYDVIQIDAFTGDNIPYHLSTAEAFQLYFHRLAPDGMLSINISNWHMDEAPLIKVIADVFGVPTIVYSVPGDLKRLRFNSVWAVLPKRPPENFAIPQNARIRRLDLVKNIPLPTDEKGSFTCLITFED